MSRSEYEILHPEPTTSGGKSRNLAPTGRRAGAVRDALFVDLATGTTTTRGSTAFVAQHLDQEWMHRGPYTDPRPGLAAYGRDRRLKRTRSDLVPPV